MEKEKVSHSCVRLNPEWYAMIKEYRIPFTPLVNQIMLEKLAELKGIKKEVEEDPKLNTCIYCKELKGWKKLFIIKNSFFEMDYSNIICDKCLDSIEPGTSRTRKQNLELIGKYLQSLAFTINKEITRRVKFHFLLEEKEETKRQPYKDELMSDEEEDEFDE